MFHQQNIRHSRSDSLLKIEAGFTLIEVVAALAVLAVALMAGSLALVHGMQHERNSFQSYRAMSALRDTIAQIQETANQPQDLSLLRGIGAVYLKYHGKVFKVPELSHGKIAVKCFANENKVPQVFGGPQDLNFDGDAGDNLANISAGTDLKLVPVALTVTFLEGQVKHTIRVRRLVTRTAG